MTTIEKIKKLLLSKEESKETKMYAEMILDDGRVLATEDEQFMIGSKVMVVGDDGETSPLDAGSYTMSDGAKITVDENSKILDLGEDKEAEEVEAEEKEELKEHEEDKDKMEEIDEEKVAMAINDATPDSVSMEKAKEYAKKIKEEMAEHEEEEKEEMKEEKEEVVEMSKDMVSSLVEEVEELKSQIVELEKTPGSNGFTHNPEVYNKSEKVDLARMSATERAAYYINNK
jgi:ethanolamine utilization protein EutA (predicted chaperonin)